LGKLNNADRKSYEKLVQPWFRGQQLKRVAADHSRIKKVWLYRIAVRTQGEDGFALFQNTADHPGVVSHHCFRELLPCPVVGVVETQN
jgi:hypothetical protein